MTTQLVMGFLLFYWLLLLSGKTFWGLSVLVKIDLNLFIAVR